MGDTVNPPIGAVPGLSDDDAELFQIALGTYIATATAPDGSISVDVSSDGTIHRWQITDRARGTDPAQLVATVIDLIGQAGTCARAEVRAGFGLALPDTAPTVPDPRTPVSTPIPPAPTPPTGIYDDAWDDDEDFYHRGKSRISAD
ncbi:hypothetical protein ACIP5Y_40675 [Nocardia sp. NPDC088792]|uniref:hypothetical protein n=1 Tax=Nocardia sp. NPDC088792 TaxID=3364332 RepID=UPI003805575D